MKLPIEHLEIMVINACQLSCQGCATFSDLRHSGYVSWDQGKEEILPWLERLDPECIGVMGGEPLMNPDLENWIRGEASLSERRGRQQCHPASEPGRNHYLRPERICARVGFDLWVDQI